MKYALLIGAALAAVAGSQALARGGYGTGSSSSSHSVSGYTTRNGTYVAPHYQTNPNSTKYDNYDTRGNVNPYTGAVGTRDPD